MKKFIILNFTAIEVCINSKKVYFEEHFEDNDSELQTRWKFPKDNIEEYSHKFDFSKGKTSENKGLYSAREKSRYAVSSMLPETFDTTINN